MHMTDNNVCVLFLLSLIKHNGCPKTFCDSSFTPIVLMAQCDRIGRALPYTCGWCRGMLKNDSDLKNLREKDLTSKDKALLYLDQLFPVVMPPVMSCCF